MQKKKHIMIERKRRRELEREVFLSLQGLPVYHQEKLSEKIFVLQEKYDIFAGKLMNP